MAQALPWQITPLNSTLDLPRANLLHVLLTNMQNSSCWDSARVNWSPQMLGKNGTLLNISHFLKQSSKVILLFTCIYKIPWSVRYFDSTACTALSPLACDTLALLQNLEQAAARWAALPPFIPSAWKSTCVPEKYQELLTQKKIFKTFL